MSDEISGEEMAWPPPHQSDVCDPPEASMPRDTDSLISAKTLESYQEIELPEHHPIHAPLDSGDIEGLGSTTLERLGVTTWHDLLSLDAHTLRQTPGVGQGKIVVIEALIKKAHGMCEAPAEAPASVSNQPGSFVQPAHHPIFEEIDARKINGLGATTLSRLGVSTWYDLLGLDAKRLAQRPGVGRGKVLVLSELIDRARVMFSGQAPEPEMPLAAQIQAHGVDISQPAVQVLRRLSTRPVNALERIGASLCEVIERVESLQLRLIEGIGSKSREEIAEHVHILAEHGLSFYMYGERGMPESTRDGVARILSELAPIDRILVHRRYRDGGTLQELGADMGQTRERVRQRIDKVLEEAALVYEDAFDTLLEPLLAVLDGNGGVLDLEIALELSPGEEHAWELIFAMDVLGRDARIYGGALYCGLTTARREELCEQVDAVLREIPHRYMTLRLASECLRDEFGIELGDKAISVMLDELLGYAREDEQSWRNSGVTEGRLYAAAIEHSEEPLSMPQIALCYQRYMRDLEPPDVRHVYMHLQRTDLIYRMEEGLYVHRNHLPVDEQDLLDVVEVVARRVHERGVLVDVAELRDELLQAGQLHASVTTALLHDALTRREDIKVFKGSTTEVAPAGSGVERTTITEQIVEQLHTLNEVIRAEHLLAHIHERGIETSEGSMVQSLNKAVDVVYLGQSRYIHKAHIGLTEAYIDALMTNAMNALPIQHPVGAARLLSQLREDPAAQFLLVRSDGIDIFWGLMHASAEVNTGLAGRAVMRPELGTDPLLAALTDYMSRYASFYPRDVQSALESEFGISDCYVALCNRIKMALNTGQLTRSEEGLYMVSSNADV